MPRSIRRTRPTPAGAARAAIGQVIRNPLARTLALIAGFGVIAGATAANQPPLGDVAEIREGLIAAAIAYEIGDKCDSLDARMMRGIAYLNGLRSTAEGLGYSEDEIRAYMEDDAEKDRLEAMARERLRSLGGVEGEWETYCAVGRAEMAADSAIGRLLR